MSTDQLRNRRGTWVFLGAVSGVQLTKATNFEYQIRNVHLVSSDHLPHRRRRFGIKPSEEFDDFFKSNEMPDGVANAGTLAKARESKKWWQFWR